MQTTIGCTSRLYNQLSNAESYVRIASWLNLLKIEVGALPAAHRVAYHPAVTDIDIGFRCARDF